MSFGEISTSFINDLVKKGAYKEDTKTKLKFKLNGADCELDTKKGVNLFDICKIFNIQIQDIKTWKSKNGSYLQANYGELFTPKVKEGEENAPPPAPKRKPIMTANCNYIDPRFIVQCLMGTNIDFNNWVTNIILGSLIYHEENDEDSLNNYREHLNEHINESQIELAAKFKESKKENNNNKSAAQDEQKYLVFRFPTGDEGKPMVKPIGASRYTKEHKEKLAENGKYNIQDFEMGSSSKITAAVKKYLEDNNIVYNTSVGQINLPNDFTEEYFDEIKDDMIKQINELVDELSKEPVKQPKKTSAKKAAAKLQQLDEEVDEPAKEMKPKPSQKPKTTSKTATKKQTVKEQKEVKETKPKPSAKPAGKFGKYSVVKVKDDDDDNGELDISFNDDE